MNDLDNRFTAFTCRLNDAVKAISLGRPSPDVELWRRDPYEWRRQSRQRDMESAAQDRRREYFIMFILAVGLISTLAALSAFGLIYWPALVGGFVGAAVLSAIVGQR